MQVIPRKKKKGFPKKIVKKFMKEPFKKYLHKWQTGRIIKEVPPDASFVDFLKEPLEEFTEMGNSR